MENNSEKRTIGGAPLWPVFLALLVVAGFWVLNLAIGLRMGDERGLFGDMFGAVNSIFSGFAFVGVVYAIFLQRHEVAIAKREIEYTKEILEEQQNQLRLQNQETRKKIFENTFFQMLRLFTDITQQIDLHRVENGVTILSKGKDVFPIFLKRFHKKYNPPAKAIYGGHEFEKSYEEFYQEHNSELGHYFRMLYNLVNFIDGSDVENKNFYAKIVRAQLSDAEIAILFYNGLSKHGRVKFKPLIERYGFLKNLNNKDVFNAALKEIYVSSAFGNQDK